MKSRQRKFVKVAAEAGGKESVSDLFNLDGALFFDDRRYRYALWRCWDTDNSPAMFIGLNPSTADEHFDDATIRRCKRFAKDLGYGGLVMANLFALRSTDPQTMLNHNDPIGLHNDKYLMELSRSAGLVIAAWGNHGLHLDRAAAVESLFPKLYCLGTPKKGQPKHPLYLPAITQPEIYSRNT